MPTTTFISSSSHLAKLWHPTKNLPLLPEKVTVGSGKKVWWQCDKEHEWEAIIGNLNKKTANFCPICNGQIVLEGFNDLATVYPELAEQWHPTKNRKTAVEVTPGSGFKAIWKCAENHEWEAAVYHRTRPDKPGCPYCTGRFAIPGLNDLKTLKPELAEQWHPTRNGNVTPADVKPMSNKKFWWLGECGHEWETTVANRNVGKNCPYCSGKTIEETINSLSYQYPNLMTYWSSDNKINPETIAPGSHVNARWIKECGHSFNRVVKDFVKNQTCVYCSGTKAFPGFNDYFTVHPQLKKEWNYELNNAYASFLRPGSDYSAWWKCDKGHEWKTQIKNRPRTGCPTCSLAQNGSKAETAILEYVKLYFPNVTGNTKIISPYHVDCYIPEKKIAIEFNGIYWHSEKVRKSKNYHMDKWLACKEQGVQLIQIWEDDWNRNPELIKRMLAHKLGVSHGKKIYARNTQVTFLSTHETKTFLNNNHIQGYSPGSIRLGLKTREGELVASIVLKKENQNTLNLIRYATSQSVPGGFTKLLNYAEKNYEPTKIVTFSDNTISDGGLYEKNGFMVETVLKPDYMYLVKNERKHKFGYRLKKFKNDPTLKYEEGLTERELALLNNLPRIWDAGKIKWVKKIAHI